MEQIVVANYESDLESSDGSMSGHPHRLSVVGSAFEVITPQLFGSILSTLGFCLAPVPAISADGEDLVTPWLKGNVFFSDLNHNKVLKPAIPLRV